jgi:hypothetical protein
MQPIQVYEIFDKFELEKSRSKRIEILKQNNIPALRDILRGMFDDTLEFNLPEGKPPYTPNRPESIPSTLLKKHRDFGYFVKGGPADDWPPYKRENSFIGLLESVHADDALLVMAMVNKKSPIKGLTKKLVKEAFPNLIKK